MTLQANLTNREAIRMPHPLVKWSYEPSRAEDVPLALSHGLHLASLPPRGPVFVSIPMDDWYAEMDQAEADEVVARRVDGRAGADPDSVRRLAGDLDGAGNPVMVVGPDVDASGGWEAAIGLAERQRLPVWATPAPGGGRIGFPEGHPNFRGVLPPAIGPVAQTLEGHDLILAVGTSVFPYYPHIPGRLLPEGAVLVAITSDPDEAARAPMGRAIVADVGLTLAALLEAVPEASRAAPEPNPGPTEIPATDPLNSSTVHTALAEVLPEDAIVVLESPASTLALRNQLRLSRPGSYYFSSGGGLGFGLAASVGVQLAQPDRPVVCVLGEGSAQYAITAFWSAVAHEVPVTFLVLNNGEYAILKWFADVEGVDGAPGLDLPKLDVAAVASGYGVNSRTATGRDEVRGALEQALSSSGPELVEVPVEPGMSLF
jgi:benzoylformate decarboxylase